MEPGWPIGSSNAQTREQPALMDMVDWISRQTSLRTPDLSRKIARENSYLGRSSRAALVESHIPESQSKVFRDGQASSP